MERLEPFLLERWQSEHEHEVEVNLSDSGVHPLTLRELLEDEEELAAVLDERLIYTQTNGTPELRRAIAAMHPGATEHEVLVTNGGAEANLVCLLGLLRDGDHAVLMSPNYMQLFGLARGLGADVDPWPLRPDFERGAWVADLAELERLVRPTTRVIALCNPNNPTGARLSAAELDGVCRIAERVGAWVLADEIYRGSDLDGEETPTAWGRSSRVLVTSSLSKSYGLPGLRLGWIVGPADLTAELWGVRDYTTIAPGALSDAVARRVLQPERRARLLARTRGWLGANYARVAEWVASRPTLRHVRPRAGAMLLVQYEEDVPSTELARRLLRESSVLIVPGAHFGLEGWLRIGFGGRAEEIERGLERLDGLLATARAR